MNDVQQDYDLAERHANNNAAQSRCESDLGCEAINDRTDESCTSLPKCFLIIHSVAKRHNIGNLLRSATAFGVSQVKNWRDSSGACCANLYSCTLLPACQLFTHHQVFCP